MTTVISSPITQLVEVTEGRAVRRRAAHDDRRADLAGQHRPAQVAGAGERVAGGGALDHDLGDAEPRDARAARPGRRAAWSVRSARSAPATCSRNWV